MMLSRSRVGRCHCCAHTSPVCHLSKENYKLSSKKVKVGENEEWNLHLKRTCLVSCCALILCLATSSLPPSCGMLKLLAAFGPLDVTPAGLRTVRTLRKEKVQPSIMT